jgi:hypothetical protein
MASFGLHVNVVSLSTVFDDTPEAMHRFDRLTRDMEYDSGYMTPEQFYRAEIACPWWEDPMCCGSPEACTA